MCAITYSSRVQFFVVACMGVCLLPLSKILLQDGSIQDYDNNFSLLSPLICEAIAVKEDRRTRRTVPQTSNPNAANSGASGAGAAGSNNNSGGQGQALNSAAAGQADSVPMDGVSDSSSSGAEGGEGAGGNKNNTFAPALESSSSVTTHQLV